MKNEDKESMRRFKADIFQALAHPTRIALVEKLQRGEMSVGQLSESLGIQQSNASQHLSILRSKFIVESRKEGNQIFYRLRDPLIGEVLEKMRQYFETHKTQAIRLMSDI